MRSDDLDDASIGFVLQWKRRVVTTQSVELLRTMEPQEMHAQVREIWLQYPLRRQLVKIRELVAIQAGRRQLEEEGRSEVLDGQ